MAFTSASSRADFARNPCPEATDSSSLGTPSAVSQTARLNMRGRHAMAGQTGLVTNAGRAATLAIFLVAGCATGTIQDPNLGRTLHDAAAANEVNLAQRLIQSGADVNGLNEKDEIPLHKASRADAVNMIRFLVEAGGDINAREGDDSTPLHEAARSDAEGAVLVLIELGADINARNGVGDTVLHRAAKSAGSGIVTALVIAGADVGARNDEGKTPLHLAAQINDRAVQPLVDAGAEINAKDGMGRTPLHEAAEYRRVNAVRLLVEAGADIEATTAGESGKTPCDYSIRWFCF